MATLARWPNLSLERRPSRSATLAAAGHSNRHGSAVVAAAMRLNSAHVFLFPKKLELHRTRLNDDESDSHTCHSVLEELRIPEPKLANIAAALLPALAATVHPAISASSSVAVPAMMPIMMPYSMPFVSSDSWLGNKRARAYHRCCVLAVYAQGAVAVLKFISGDLVGGLFDSLQAAIGACATQPDGSKLMPTYVMVTGFNGVLNILQIFQNYQGISLRHLPLLVSIPPVVSILAAYCGWQFCRELRAIASGYTGEGPQDSCFVHLCGADCWLLSLLSPLPRGDRSTISASGITFRDRQGFEAFGGSGQRLGEA